MFSSFLFGCVSHRYLSTCLPSDSRQKGLKGVGGAQIVLDKSIRGSKSKVDWDREVKDGAGQENVNLIINELLRRKSG